MQGIIGLKGLFSSLTDGGRLDIGLALAEQVPSSRLSLIARVSCCTIDILLIVLVFMCHICAFKCSYVCMFMDIPQLECVLVRGNY
jgi:hypothetical protein